MTTVQSIRANSAGQADIAANADKRRPSCPAFLQAIAALPSLNDAFRNCPLALLDSQGKVVSKDACGTLGDVGVVEPSRVGSEIVAEVIRRYGGFQHVGESRMRWAYVVPDRIHAPWSAIAVFGNWLIDSTDGVIDRIYYAELRNEFARRNVPAGEGSTKRIENRFRIADLLERIRFWRQIPRLVPTLYRAAVANGLDEFLLPRDVLAKEFFDPSRRWPYDWEQQLERALVRLGKTEIYQVRLAPVGWQRCVFGQLPAIAKMDFSGEEICFRLAKDFVEFLKPFFPEENPRPSCPPQLDQAKPHLHQGPVNAMEPASAKPESKPAPVADKKGADEGRQRQVQCVEQALPAVHLATIAGKSLKQEVDVATYLEYLNQLIASGGNPADPVARMMYEQLAFAHCRIGQLHASAACATSAQLEVTFTLAAAKLMAEFRKTSLALKEYRMGLVQQGVDPAPVRDKKPVEAGAAPQPTAVASDPLGKIDDTELTTNGSIHRHGKYAYAAANRSPSKSGTAQGIDSCRPSKASRNGNRESALATLHGA